MVRSDKLAFHFSAEGGENENETFGVYPLHPVRNHRRHSCCRTSLDSTPRDKAKVFKMNKKTGAVEKNEFVKEPTPEQLKEIRRALGLAENQDPGADDIIFYHSPTPGTCYWVGYWRCY
jgi:hypothetical protein